MNYFFGKGGPKKDADDDTKPDADSEPAPKTTQLHPAAATTPDTPPLLARRTTDPADDSFAQADGATPDEGDHAEADTPPDHQSEEAAAGDMPAAQVEHVQESAEAKKDDAADETMWEAWFGSDSDDDKKTQVPAETSGATEAADAEPPGAAEGQDRAEGEKPAADGQDLMEGDEPSAEGQAAEGDDLAAEEQNRAEGEEPVDEESEKPADENPGETLWDTLFGGSDDDDNETANTAEDTDAVEGQHLAKDDDANDPTDPTDTNPEFTAQTPGSIDTNEENTAEQQSPTTKDSTTTSPV